MTPEPTDSSVSADAANIASEIFGPSETPPTDSGASATSTSQVASTATPTTAAVAVAAQTGMSEEQYNAMPKAWRKEMEADWNGMPIAARRYVHDRETQVERGFSQARPAITAWNAVQKALEPVLASNPGLDAGALVNGLIRNHMVMASASSTEKAEYAREVLRHYGVDVGTLQAAANTVQQTSADDFTPKQLEKLRSLLGPLAGTVQSLAGQSQAQQQQTNQKAVDAFFSDPQNQFAEEAGPDMLQLIQQRKAGDLTEAYELACLRNPTIKARYLAALGQVVPPAGSKPPIVNAKSSTVAASPGKAISIDDTLNAIASKHYK